MTDENADIINAYLGKGNHAPKPSKAIDHRSGYVAVVGQPNVGKSTLVNAIIGHHVAITSPKAQTTRKRILGILNRPGVQLLFLDTPGIHTPKHALNKFMMQEVDQALKDADAVLFVVDVSLPLRDADREIAERLVKVNRKVILAMNKSDQLQPQYVVQNVEGYAALVNDGVSAAADGPTTLDQLGTYRNAVLTSATRGDNLDKLITLLLGVLPEGPEYYPADQVTDQTDRILAAEFIREQALKNLNEEVPHAVAVQVDEYTERKSGGAYVVATIYVERESQKGIIIGDGGRMLKTIGTGARKLIEQETGRKVFLELWVKVRSNWREDERMVNQLMDVDNT